MAFDFTLAVARLEANEDVSGTAHAALAARYPELKFVFDALEDARTDSDALLEAKEAEFHRVTEALSEVAERCARMRDMVEILTRMSGHPGVVKELVALVRMLDDAAHFADKAAG